MQEVLARSYLLLRSLLASSPGIQGCPESDLGAPMIQKEQNSQVFPSAGAQSVQKAKRVFIQSGFSTDKEKGTYNFEVTMV